MRKISKIEPTMPAVAAKKKVAGYARISMESERMHWTIVNKVDRRREKNQKSSSN